MALKLLKNSNNSVSFTDITLKFVVVETYTRSFPKTLLLTVGYNPVCLLVKYIANHWMDLMELSDSNHWMYLHDSLPFNVIITKKANQQ